MLATLHLLCVEGVRPVVTLIMCLLQKQSLGIVQPDPGCVGPLLTDIVPNRLLNLMMLHVYGLVI